MKNLALTILAGLALLINLSAQENGKGQPPELGCSCLPNGIIFTNQAQIDNFPINYPGCTKIKGNVRIVGPGITNLNGLSTLASIGGHVRIDYTDLTCLTGLDGLTSIGGYLEVDNNHVLVSLIGLENIEASSISDLYIRNNESLSTCDIQSVCDYLANPGGSINIYYNADGCNNPTEVANVCSITLTCLPFGNYWFSNQSDVDSFQNNFPGCFELEGNVHIIGRYITNLSGLSQIITISGSLFFNNNVALTCMTGLNNLTSVGGQFSIRSFTALSNFTGLDNLSSIGGSIKIGYNSVLTSLTGLESLVSIGGALNLFYNNALTSLTGLNNLVSTGGVNIHNNRALTNLTGLDSLTNINGFFDVQSNRALSSLTGVNNLTHIEGDLRIGGSVNGHGNRALTSLSGLDNLTSIAGDLLIANNEALNSLSGMDSIAYIGGDLNIYRNSSLATCGVEWLCDYLAEPQGVVTIYGNKTGCNLMDLAPACGNVPCLPYGAYYFYRQSDIDNFSHAFPDCFELQGNVFINGNNINNLNALSQIISIGKSFSIRENPSLSSLVGLENIISIGGQLEIFNNPTLSSLEGLDYLTSIGGNLKIPVNPSLLCLTGLENLTSVGGNLEFWRNDSITILTGLENLTSIGADLYIGTNNSLLSLSGLENLTSIGGTLRIMSNSSLTSLAGLENIDGTSISYLDIRDNSSLSTCEVQSICDYLATPDASLLIHANAPGCNSAAEIKEACLTLGIEEAQSEQGFLVFPNPFTEQLEIEFWLEKPGLISVTVYNIMGQLVAKPAVKQFQPGSNRLQLDGSNLPPGLYFLRLQADAKSITQKIIKH